MASPYFPSCKVYYADPELAVDGRSISWSSMKEKNVDLKAIYDSLIQLVDKYATDKDAGVALDPNNYVWNYYTLLGIPENSNFYHGPSQRGEKQPQRGLTITEGMRMVLYYVSMEIFRKICKYDSGTQRGTFSFLDEGHPHQMFWRISQMAPINTSRATDYTTRNMKKQYKIHITPKHPYVMFTLFRIFSMIKDDEMIQNKSILGKILMDFRADKPNPTNTQLTELNGGAAPIMVLYMGEDSTEVGTLLDKLLNEFQNDVDTIGAMTIDYRYRVLPFNIRLNSLFCYAQGDRCQKLDARDEYKRQLSRGKTGTELQAYKQYFMPQWITRIINDDNVSELSMQLFGKDISSTYYSSITTDPTCIDDICWMTAYPEHFLDPTSLSNFTLERVSTTTIAEADTTSNNDAEVCAVEATGAGAGLVRTTVTTGATTATNTTTNTTTTGASATNPTLGGKRKKHKTKKAKRKAKKQTKKNLRKRF